ncbi:MAG: hypothetical protein LWY06_10380 [Firmicutes bacterium]|nr:hypothetical protein [Bacillota bacterium]
MRAFTYLNRDNFLRLAKYFFGFVAIYAVTITYIVKEKSKPETFNLAVAVGFVVMCCLFSIPFIKIFMQVFFERLVVTDNEIQYYRYFRKSTLAWTRVQYFIRLPSRGFFSGLVIFYEMGDFKRAIRFESTISERDELIEYIQAHVGKLRQVRKRYR